MKQIFQELKGEKGAALITVLLFLIMMTLLGMAAIWTGTTETSLGGNERLNKEAHYLAESGLQEAMARLDYSDSTNLAYYIDTDLSAICTSATTPRHANVQAAWASGKVFTRPIGFNNYSVYIMPSFEDDTFGGGFHNYSSSPTNYHDQLILYNQPFKYPDSAIQKANGGFPVFHIIAVSKIRDPHGNIIATARVQADVTKNAINLTAPAGLYSNVCPDFTGHCGAYSNVSGIPAMVNPAGCTPGTCGGAGANAQAGFINMSSYLGIPVSQMKQFANQVYTAGGPVTNFGHYPDDPQIIYYNGNLGSLGPGTGYGILIVTGDVTSSGGTCYHGLVYCMGNLTINGGGSGCGIVGGTMVKGTVTGHGVPNAHMQYDQSIIDQVTKKAFKSKLIVWKEIH